jgi:hypothetical protein
MTLDKILDDLIGKTGSIEEDAPTNGHDRTVTTSHSIIRTIEVECNKCTRDPNLGTHFVGILLVVFAAQVVLFHWSRTKHERTDNAPPKMLTCLYSQDFVTLLLCRPSEVICKRLR